MNVCENMDVSNWSIPVQSLALGASVLYGGAGLFLLQTHPNDAVWLLGGAVALALIGFTRMAQTWDDEK